MEFNEVIRKRYSTRSYRPDPIEEEKLNQILEAARLAPTADNRQPFRLIIIHTKGREEQLRRIYNREWFVQAPIIICACGVLTEGWVNRKGKSYMDVDVAIVMDHIVLEATNVGLGTCWVAAFDEDAAREVLGLPAHVVPIVFSPLGYPADQPSPKKRKSLDELIKYEHW